jgi:hypothetical protein
MVVKRGQASQGLNVAIGIFPVCVNKFWMRAVKALFFESIGLEIEQIFGLLIT